MPHYYVKVMVEFSGTVHADSQSEAEDYACTNWSVDAGAQIQYDGVYSSRVQSEEEADEELENCPPDCPDVAEYEAEQEEEDEAEDE
jgi:hypothetical protein